MCYLDNKGIRKENFLVLVFTSAELCLSLNSETLRRPMRARAIQGRWCFWRTCVISTHRCLTSEALTQSALWYKTRGSWSRLRKPLEANGFELVVFPDSNYFGAK